MSIQQLSDQGYRRALGGGLVLRWSTASDLERIGKLYYHVFREAEDSPPNLFMQAWLRDLMGGKHPLIEASDFALVEDTETGAAVAATCLIAQEWEYEGIAFPVGRPEIVASMPEYRNRGLVRAVFELIHARSAVRGQLAQAITGIEYFYRQFGYEYALDLGGNRSVYFSAIPKLKPDAPEPYALRNATAEDLPRVAALYDRERVRGPVSTRIDTDYWRWMLEGQSNEAGEGSHMRMIVDSAGNSVGYLLLSRRRWDDAIGVHGLALEPGVALPSVLPSVMRAVQASAGDVLTAKPDTPPAARISFGFFRSHAVYDVLDSNSTYNPPYAWYVRVPDLPRFIQRIAPALERRLAASSASGYTGALKLDFYRSGLQLAFEQGRLTLAEDYRDQGFRPKYDAGFPPLVFLQLLFGHRSLAQLREIFPDVWAENAVRPVLEALFPARPSWVVPLE